MKFHSVSYKSASTVDIMDEVFRLYGVEKPKGFTTVQGARQSMSRITAALGAVGIDVSSKLKDIDEALSYLEGDLVTPSDELIAADHAGVDHFYLWVEGLQVGLAIYAGIGGITAHPDNRIEVLPLEGPGFNERGMYLASVLSASDVVEGN